MMKHFRNVGILVEDLFVAPSPLPGGSPVSASSNGPKRRMRRISGIGDIGAELGNIAHHALMNQILVVTHAAIWHCTDDVICLNHTIQEYVSGILMFTCSLTSC